MLKTAKISALLLLPPLIGLLLVEASELARRLECEEDKAHNLKHLIRRHNQIDNTTSGEFTDTENGDWPIAAAQSFPSFSSSPESSSSSSSTSPLSSSQSASSSPTDIVNNKQILPPAESSLTRQQMAAYALAQEASKAALIKNAEMCRDFSIGIQHETGGSFTSPNYPNPYPVNLNCTRLIEAPIGHYIVLEFRDQFNIEEAGNDCDNDKIEIRDGRYGYSKVLARYCGSKFPHEVRSTNEAMWLRFISDASISHTGFKAIYRFAVQKNIKPNPPFECRFNVTSMTNLPGVNATSENRTGIHSGVIRNSDVPEELLKYSKDFNVSLECIWNITVMPGWKIYLTFSNYELNKPNDCDSNFIEIYEENLTEENQTVKFCGTRTEPQQSKSNVFNIRHHALPTASGSKFEIIYTAFRDKGQDGCDANREFDCDDGTCIHESLKCDGQVNCKYRYDEASDPGPCIGIDPDGSFFETEHMVIILIVFLTLVSGMCASIIVSCWGKIQERRRSKLEYHMRKSREASMEGQLNKVDQILYSNDRSASSNGKHRIATVANEVQSQQQTSSKYPLETAPNGRQRFNGVDLPEQQFLPGLQYQQHPTLGQMIADGSLGTYGVFGGSLNVGQSSTSLETKGEPLGKTGKQVSMFGSRSRVHDSVTAQTIENLRKSQQNLQQSILSMANKQQADQTVSGSKQQSVPDISFNNNQLSKQKQQMHNAARNQILSISNETLAQDIQQQQQQQMLNLSLVRNQLSQKQHQKLIGSIYQQHSNDNSNNNNGNTSNNSADLLGSNQYGRFLQQQTSLGPTLGGGIGASGLRSAAGVALLNQSASAQTMPISLAKFSLNQAAAQMVSEVNGGHQQNVNCDTNAGSQFANDTSQCNPQQRALTLSAMHQPIFGNHNNNNQQQPNIQAIYGFNPTAYAGQTMIADSTTNNNNLSSSMSCCDALGDCLGSNETPLINDVILRSNHQQQHRMMQQVPQNSRIYELRSATIGSRTANAAIPRSLSAYQLSRTQIRQQSQQQQQHQFQQLQQRQQQQLRQQLQQQITQKSASDAEQAHRHQMPNHSLSYPHACTGQHNSDMPGNMVDQSSPALPPPPPPPNLVQVRSATSCGMPQSVGKPRIETRRAAFKVSRLDASQLTVDTLNQDPELMMAANNMHFDEPSTESDATFGVLMNNSIGNTPLNLGHLRGVGPVSQQAMFLKEQQAYRQGPYAPAPPAQTRHLMRHLNDCIFIRRQRHPELVNMQQQQSQLVCDCGALDQANRLAASQQAGSSREYDSDEGACMIQAPSFADNDILLAQQQQQHSNGSSSIYGSRYQQRQQQQFARFQHQSSELTGDDDEDEVDDDNVAIDGVDVCYNMDQLDDEMARVNAMSDQKNQFRSRSVIRNEELRDEPNRQLSGSHTSLGCQSCTCGSQLQLNNLAADEDSSDTANQPTKARPQSRTGKGQIYDSLGRRRINSVGHSQQTGALGSINQESTDRSEEPNSSGNNNNNNSNKPTDDKCDVVATAEASKNIEDRS